MSQNAKLLNWFQTRKTIEPMQALNRLGIYRLGARVFDLRNSGHVIHNSNPHGKPALYVYLGKEQGVG